jgi:uncharacterized protein (DUF983 family)
MSVCPKCHSGKLFQKGNTPRFICPDCDAEFTLFEAGKLEKLLKALREAGKLFDGINVVNFCIDCMKPYSENELSKHLNHNTIFTDVDHDGIGEWIAALEWVKREMQTSTEEV